MTLQPVDALGVDAAILFADILLPLVPMGIQLEFAAGEGPVIHNPINCAADVAALGAVEPRESLASVMQALKMVRRELDGKVALIGFAGAPFTLASYIIEGGASRNYLKTKRLMYSDPQTWHLLMGKLARVIGDYLNAQVEAGAQVVQLFDSWVGTLPPEDYREYVLPHSQAIFQALENADVPTIHFGTGTASLLPLLREAGGSVIGVDTADAPGLGLGNTRTPRGGAGQSRPGGAVRAAGRAGKTSRARAEAGRRAARAYL